MRLKDKVAVITGAGKGIGRAGAVLFAREGAAVVVADIDAGNGRATVREICRNRGQAIFVQADVSRTAQVKKMVSAAIREFGSLHILYNNAGVFLSTDNRVTEVEERIWDRIMDTNLKSTFLCCKYAIPEILRSGGGAIINTSSSAGVNHNFDEKRFFKMAPAGRYGKPEEVARLALFLASDQASFCYGGLFVADGGVTIRNLSY